MEHKKKLDARDSLRLNSEEKQFIKDVSLNSGIDKNSIYRIGAIKEAKRILKQIEKDK